MMKNVFPLTIFSVSRSLWLFAIAILTTSITSSLYSRPINIRINIPILIKHDISELMNGLLEEKPFQFDDALTIHMENEENIEVRSQANETVPVIFGKKGEYLFHGIIIECSERHQVDPLLVKAIIMAESSYNPYAISKVGARGLMQLMPKTARELGVEDSFNPSENIDAGVRYFKKLLVRFDWDIEMALAAYNAGSRTVLECQGVPQIEATQNYIKKVCKYYQNYKDIKTLETNQMYACMLVTSHMI